MANHVSHAALPYPVKGCRYTIGVPYLDADGDPTDPTTPDTERSIDGAAFADCTEEVSTITGSNGSGYITLTGDEMNGSLIEVAAKVASGPKATLIHLYPRVLAVLFSGTATAGAAGSITLSATNPPLVDDLIKGCIIRTTGGTGGGGGSGSQNNQGRICTGFVASTRVASVAPNFETSPSSDTTYEVLLTDAALIRFSDLKTVKGALLNDLISGRMDSIASAIAASAINAAAMAADMNSYTTRAWLAKESTSNDKYIVQWYRNGQIVTSGITLPKIRVFNESGTDLIAETAMTEIGSTQSFKFEEATNKLTPGEIYMLEAKATIDSAVRTDRQPVMRDST